MKRTEEIFTKIYLSRRRIKIQYLFTGSTLKLKDVILLQELYFLGRARILFLGYLKTLGQIFPELSRV